MYVFMDSASGINNGLYITTMEDNILSINNKICSPNCDHYILRKYMQQNSFRFKVDKIFLNITKQCLIHTDICV